MIRCCYKCTERHDLCHSTCERYLAEKAATDEERTKLYAEKQIDADLSNLGWHRVTTRKKKKHVR